MRCDGIEKVSNGKGADFLIVVDDELLDGDKLARLGIQTLEDDTLFSLSEDTTKELPCARSRCFHPCQCQCQCQRCDVMWCDVMTAFRCELELLFFLLTSLSRLT